MISTIIIVAVIAILLISFWVIYNKVVSAKNIVDEAISGIDVQLKKRHELIPNLVEAVKGYNSHEADVLEKLVQLRSGKGVQEISQYDQSITSKLKEFRVIIEDYPDLKSNVQFLKLMDNLSEVEKELAMSRRYFNGTVRDYNITIQEFPAVIVANLFGFGEKAFYEIDASETEVPDITLSE